MEEWPGEGMKNREIAGEGETGEWKGGKKMIGWDRISDIKFHPRSMEVPSNKNS